MLVTEQLFGEGIDSKNSHEFTKFNNNFIAKLIDAGHSFTSEFEKFAFLLFFPSFLPSSFFPVFLVFSSPHILLTTEKYLELWNESKRTEHTLQPHTRLLQFPVWLSIIIIIIIIIMLTLRVNIKLLEVDLFIVCSEGFE